jgi:hypothetical protein
MELEGSLPRSQQPTTDFYPQPDQSSLYQIIPSNTDFNITQPTHVEGRGHSKIHKVTENQMAGACRKNGR